MASFWALMCQLILDNRWWCRRKMKRCCWREKSWISILSVWLQWLTDPKLDDRTKLVSQKADWIIILYDSDSIMFIYIYEHFKISWQHQRRMFVDCVTEISVKSILWRQKPWRGESTGRSIIIPPIDPWCGHQSHISSCNGIGGVNSGEGARIFGSNGRTDDRALIECSKNCTLQQCEHN